MRRRRTRVLAYVPPSFCGLRFKMLAVSKIRRLWLFDRDDARPPFCPCSLDSCNALKTPSSHLHEASHFHTLNEKTTSLATSYLLLLYHRRGSLSASTFRRLFEPSRVSVGPDAAMSRRMGIWTRSAELEEEIPFLLRARFCGLSTAGLRLDGGPLCPKVSIRVDRQYLQVAFGDGGRVLDDLFAHIIVRRGRCFSSALFVASFGLPMPASIHHWRLYEILSHRPWANLHVSACAFRNVHRLPGWRPKWRKVLADWTSVSNCICPITAITDSYTGMLDA
ncbi:hypothetical protein C8F01DRAFT_271746 [Mycena amicta]|nr:hypothetical protein C8F01DRAFT_271746 [Mycena amicta]